MKKVETAKKILKNAVIGLAIIFASFSIAQFILSRLLEATGAGWQRVDTDRGAITALSGSLGSGVIQDHYPPRSGSAPRNTKILVTFKQEMDPASVNATNVKIYPTDEGDTAALTADEMEIRTVDNITYVFDPIDYLGNSVTETDYTAALSADIELTGGGTAFTGTYSGGYAWTFTITTEIDVTPPQVSSIIPTGTGWGRNITVQVNFNEAIDPTSASGTYSSGGFTNITLASGSSVINGAYVISNGYKTVEFTSAESCGAHTTNSCNEPIFCFPGSATIDGDVKAATLSGSTEQPSAADFPYDGVVDVASNSLDGDEDGIAQGAGADDRGWTFGTTDEVVLTPPLIDSITPDICTGEVDGDQVVTFQWDQPMRTSTITNSTVGLTIDPTYEVWFSPTSTLSADSTYHTTEIGHGLLLDDTLFAPVLTSQIKSLYQNCFYPSSGYSSCTGSPYCCNGVGSDNACEDIPPAC